MSVRAIPPALPEGRRAALAAFYTHHHQQLRWRVRRDAPGTVVADACASAWLTLVRRADIRLNADGLAWLTTVAIHEAWRLARRDEHPSGLFLTERELSEPAGPAADPLDRAIAAEQHHDRVARFAALKPREQRDLLLKAGGYSYDEIAQITGSSYCAVNRRLSEGRAQLRHSA